MRKRSAFTLVEVLVAFLILAIVLGTIHALVFSTMATRQMLVSQAAVERAGARILSLITRDLEATFVYRADVATFVGEPVSGPGGRVDRVDFLSTASSLTIGPPLPGADEEARPPRPSPVNEVGYRLEVSQEEPSVYLLIRREDYYVDRQPLEGGTLMLVHDRVKSLLLSYSDGRQWLDSWNSLARKGFPRTARIDLVLETGPREGPSLPRRFRTSVPLPRTEEDPSPEKEKGPAGAKSDENF